MLHFSNFIWYTDQLIYLQFTLLTTSHTPGRQRKEHTCIPHKLEDRPPGLHFLFVAFK